MRLTAIGHLHSKWPDDDIGMRNYARGVHYAGPTVSIAFHAQSSGATESAETRAQCP